MREANKRGIKLTLGSDAHVPENVGNYTDRLIEIVRFAGYSSLIRFRRRKMIEEEI